MRMKHVRNKCGDYFFVPHDYAMRHSDIYGNTLYSNPLAFQDMREFKTQIPIYVQTEWHNDDGSMQIERSALGETDIQCMLDMPIEEEIGMSRDWWNNESGDLIIRTFHYGKKLMVLTHCKYSSGLDFSDKKPKREDIYPPLLIAGEA